MFTSLKLVCQQLSLLLRHPLVQKDKIGGLRRYLQWQIASKQNKSVSLVVPFVGSSKLILNHACTPMQTNFYTGLADFEMAGFLLHFLQEEDTFYDVGAFIGVYTVLASAVCGAQTVAFEPTSTSWHALEDNIRLNCLETLVKTVNVAVGPKSGEVSIGMGSTRAKNYVLQERNTAAQHERAQQITLNETIATHGIPSLLKIDAEGYEVPILRGATALLSNSSLKAIVIESWASAEIFELLSQNGFSTFEYDPLTRELKELTTRRHDELYLRDLDFVRRRLSSAPIREVNGVKF